MLPESNFNTGTCFVFTTKSVNWKLQRIYLKNFQLTTDAHYLNLRRKTSRSSQKPYKKVFKRPPSYNITKVINDIPFVRFFDGTEHI